MAREADQVELADRPRSHRLAGGAIAGVEAALEADLEEDAGPADELQGGVGCRQVERDRLLAEAGQAGLGGERDQVGVGGGGGGDGEGVDPGARQVVRGGDAPGSDREPAAG